MDTPESTHNGRRSPDFSIWRATPEDVWRLWKPSWLKGLFPILAFGIGILGLRATTSAIWRLRERAQALYLFDNQSLPDGQGVVSLPIEIASAWHALRPFAIALAILWGLERLFGFLFRENYKRQRSETWIASNGDRAIGQATVTRVTFVTPATRTESVNVLASLNVEPEYWWQGIGTELLQTTLKQADRNLYPLYATCVPSLLPFYQRLGFEVVKREALPRSLHRPSADFFVWIVLQEPPTEILESCSTASQLPPGVSIHLVRGFQQRWRVYRAFWRDRAFRRSRFVTWAWFSLACTICLLPQWIVAGLIYGWLATKALTPYVLFVWQGTTSSVAYGLTVVGIVILRALVFDVQQEWVAIANGRFIAYLHLSSADGVSALHHLAVKRDRCDLSLTKRIVLRLSSRIAMPLYVNSSRQNANQFAQLDYDRVHPRHLPLAFKLLPSRHAVAMRLTQRKAALLATAQPAIATRDESSISQRPSPLEAKLGWPIRRWFGVTGLALVGLWALSPLVRPSQVKLNETRRLERQARSRGPMSERIVPPMHRGRVQAIAFSRDGKTAIVG
ncbi:MAG: GNAT family N-acetyltransferase, partial [Cyanobacteria bacterium J06639_1]